MDDSFMIEERYGNKVKKVYIGSANDDRQFSVIKDSKNKESKLSQSVQHFLTSAFLPQGYPESVSEDYLEYQVWDSLQSFASSVTNTLATSALLKGVGVGDSAATPLAATINWLLRDGTSMLGRIMFAYVQGTKLDSDCKKWRFFADIINDIAISIEIFSPYLTGFMFTLTYCVSGLVKSIVGTAGGATRAAFTQHQARKDNLADVSVKDGSQETLVNLIALIWSLLMMPLISDSPTLIWSVYLVFTFLHVYSNYRAVKAVVMESLNLQRYFILVDHYLRSDGDVLSVKEVNQLENVWFYKSDSTQLIPMGVSLQTHVKSCKQLKQLRNIFNDEFILTFDCSKKPPINISLNRRCSSKAMLEAVFQAVLIYYAQKTLKSNDWKLQQIIDELNSSDFDSTKLLKMTRKYSLDECQMLIEKANKSGWNMNRVIFAPHDWNYDYQLVNPINKLD